MNYKIIDTEDEQVFWSESKLKNAIYEALEKLRSCSLNMDEEDGAIIIDILIEKLETSIDNKKFDMLVD